MGILIETLSGTTWTPVQVPLPPNESQQLPFSILNAVSCSTVSFCVATGYYNDNVGVGTYEGLIETLSGGTWNATEAPLPTNAGSYDAFLSALQCPAVGTCVAMGNYSDQNDNQQGLIETLSAGEWTPTEAPLPADAEANPQATLSAVACTSMSSCVGIGSYQVVGGAPFVFETLSDGAWTASQASLPANGSVIQFAPTSILDSIVCPTAGSCLAVGGYLNTTRNGEGLIEMSSQGRLTPSAAPLPANAALNPSSSLGDVACPAAGTCVAVGTYTDKTGILQDLIETLSAGAWSGIQAPLPANANTTPGDDLNNLTAVACASAVFCVAVGDYIDAQGNYQALIETLSGGTWTSTEAPLPSNASADPGFLNNYLSAVTCVSVGSCIATGDYADTGGNQHGLIETLSGGNWAATELPLPADADGDSEPTLSFVNCVAVGSCVAAGGYFDTSETMRAVIETLSGGTWTPIEPSLPGNSEPDGASGISSGMCSSTGSCWATGLC